MSAKICLECFTIFDEPSIQIETHGLDTPPYEKHAVCPYCGGTWAELIRCDGCGQPIIEEYIYIRPTGDRFCNNCFVQRKITG